MKKLNSLEIEEILGSELGPFTTRDMTREIMKLKVQTLSKIEKIISKSWGPNITKIVMNKLKNYMRTH